jgi:hypothetical protein
MNPPSENAHIRDPRLQYYSHFNYPSAAGPYYAAYSPQPPRWGFTNPAVPNTPGPSQPQIKFHNTFAPQNMSFCIPRATQQPPQASTDPSVTSNSTNAQKRSSQGNPNGQPASKRPHHSNVENIPPPNPSNPSQTSSTTVRFTETGPFMAPVGASTPQHPAFTAFASILPKDKKNSQIATDVWFFMK